MSEQLARLFHETYERLAPSFGYETRKGTAVPWEQVPERNKKLMIAVADLIELEYFSAKQDGDSDDEMTLGDEFFASSGYGARTKKPFVTVAYNGRNIAQSLLRLLPRMGEWLGGGGEEVNIERNIRRLWRHKETLSINEVDKLLEWIYSADPKGQRGLASADVLRRAEEIEQANEEERKLRLASDFLDWLVSGFNRQRYLGKTVYYTRWALGKQSLWGDGNEIGICPVCGRRGEIVPPNQEYDFAGETVHVMQPFFMGQSNLDSCNWATSVNMRQDKKTGFFVESALQPPH